MATVPAPVELPVSDKLEHMAAFLTITLLGCAAYPRLSRTRLLVALVVFGGLIELVQLIPQLHRDSEWSDWLADIAATLVAVGGDRLFERIRAGSADVISCAKDGRAIACADAEEEPLR
jgi:hypothetical protein